MRRKLIENNIQKYVLKIYIYTKDAYNTKQLFGQLSYSFPLAPGKKDIIAMLIKHKMKKETIQITAKWMRVKGYGKVDNCIP